MINEKSNNFKPPHQFIDIERLVSQQYYAFTINAAEDNDAYPTQYDYYDNVMKNLYKRGLWYELYPEYSNSMKLHFHGFIKFTTTKSIIPIYKKLNDLKKYFTFAIKEIQDYQWQLYCLKSRHIMQPYSSKNRRTYKLTIPETRTFYCYPIDTKSQFMGLD